MSIHRIHATKAWEEFADDSTARNKLLEALQPQLHHMRWFGGKAYQLKALNTDHCLPLHYDGSLYYLFIFETTYFDHSTEYYLLPLSLSQEKSEGCIAEYINEKGEYFIYDAVYDSHFHRALFEYTLQGAPIATNNGQLDFDRGTKVLASEKYHSSRNPGVDQSNSSIFFNERYFMKIYRKLFLETNPEVEMLKFLTQEGHFENIPAYSGSLVWSRKKTPPVTFALMMNKVNADKDSWVSTGDELNDFLRAFIEGEFSIHEFVFENVELLAKRTAEMHLALSVNTKDKLFKIEKFTPSYRTWLYDHLCHLLEGRLHLLEQRKDQLDEEAREMAEKLQRKKGLVMKFFEQVKKKPLKSLRTRIHGDYHLGQILYYNRDYVIIDFEGEPESSIHDRKIKHSPIKDVAGIVRSFHYAVSAKLFFSSETKTADRVKLQKSADRWYYLISDTFWTTYYKHIGQDNPLYASKSEINFLFLLHLLEKAIYEIGYELNGRPDWLKIPLKGIVHVINELEKYEG